MNQMGITLHTLHMLSHTLPLLGDLSDKKLLTLGVQDCYFTYDQVITFLRRHGIPHRPLDSEEIMLTTGFKYAPLGTGEKYRDCIHQNTLFRLLDFSPENVYSMDVSDFEGASIVHDLNTPVSSSLTSSFDLIFDGGTIEHVFSIKDALFNLCRMCKVGGIVVNSNPVDYINHGFVNLSAEIFRDCYLLNGFEEIEIKYIALPRHYSQVNRHYLVFNPDDYLPYLHSYYLTQIYSVFRKVQEKPLVVPQQGSSSAFRSISQAPTSRKGNERRTLYQKTRDKVWSGIMPWVDAHPVSSVLFHATMHRRRGKKVML